MEDALACTFPGCGPSAHKLFWANTVSGRGSSEYGLKVLHLLFILFGRSFLPLGF